MKEILNITHVKLDLNPLLPPGQNVSKREKLQVIFCPMSSELLLSESLYLLQAAARVQGVQRSVHELCVCMNESLAELHNEKC